MHASHKLLGRLWLFDRELIYDEFQNRHSLVNDSKIITLISLTPKQVYEDQLKLKEETEAERSEKKEVVEMSEKKEMTERGEKRWAT